MTADAPPVIAIETGGTKIKCALVTGSGRIEKATQFPTASPKDSIKGIIDYVMARYSDSAPAAIGLASFGPIGLDPLGSQYGQILNTPKPGWSGADILKPIRAAAPDLPIALDTDVNGAALGEMRYGAGQGLSDLVYVTVGTGVGAGAIVNGASVRGRIHPEMGHMRPAAAPTEGFKGICPFHGNCVEGLVSGPAIESWTGLEGNSIPDDHPVWSAVARILGTFCAMLTFCFSPQRIIMGGGVMARPFLLPMIRRACMNEIGGYTDLSAIDGGPESYIVPPGLSSNAGIIGAACLAWDKLAADIG